MKLTREEWETHISIDAEGTAIIDTSIPKDINKCKKLGYEIVKENNYKDGSIRNVIFKAPRRAIGFRSPEKREVSVEQRMAAAERLRKAREGKQNEK